MTAVHIHGPAAAGVNAGVIQSICNADDAPACETGTVNGVLVAGAANYARIPFDSLLVLIGERDGLCQRAHGRKRWRRDPRADRRAAVNSGLDFRRWKIGSGSRAIICLLPRFPHLVQFFSNSALVKWGSPLGILF